MALRDRLHSAEQENLKRSKELNLVLDEIKRAIAEKQALRDINRTWSSLSGERGMLRGMNVSWAAMTLCSHSRKTSGLVDKSSHRKQTLHSSILMILNCFIFHFTEIFYYRNVRF